MPVGEEEALGVEDGGVSAREQLCGRPVELVDCGVRCREAFYGPPVGGDVASSQLLEALG